MSNWIKDHRTVDIPLEDRCYVLIYFPPTISIIMASDPTKLEILLFNDHVEAKEMHRRMINNKKSKFTESNLHVWTREIKFGEGEYV